MPSDPVAAPTSASPTDTALVERAGRGDRQALAILYARHAPAVHARAVQAGAGPRQAAQVVRDVFRKAAGSLGATAATEPRVWLRGLTMDRLAGGGPAPRLRPETAAAVTRAGAALTVDLRDAIWRELERGWHEQALPLWKRKPATLAAGTLVGLLTVAVLVVGLLVRAQIRPVTPAGAVALTAEPVAVAPTEDAPPPPAPSVIVPPVQTEEPFVAPEEPVEPTGSPVPPSPEPDPGPTATEPEPQPSETGTEEPSEDPSTPPLLPLPGEDPSESPSEGAGTTNGSGTAGGGGTASPAPTEGSTEGSAEAGDSPGTGDAGA